MQWLIAPDSNLGKSKSCIGRSENGLSHSEAVVLVATCNKWLGMTSGVTGGEKACHSGKRQPLWSHISSCKGAGAIEIS